MILNPLLRKILTVALALPIGVVGTSSYADCAADAQAEVSAESYNEWIVERAHGSDADHHEAGEATDVVKGGRLSRSAFYGDETARAVTEL